MFHVNNPWEQTTGKTFAWLGDTNSVVVSNTPAPGFYSIQRENSNSFKMYFANAGNAHSLIASDTTTTRTTFVRPQHIFLFCYYDGNICGGCNFSSNTINFFANEWNYLSSAQSAAVYARVKAYRDIVAAQLFTLQPTNSTVLFGNNKTLAATYGYGSPTYQWQKNGVNIGGATQSSYTVTGAALSDFGNYKCIADDGGVFVNSASIQLATVTTTTTSNWLQTCYINKSVLVSSNSIWGVDQFWNGLVTDGLDSNMIILNPIVPDSLLAALTPLIAGPGSTLWVNHSFTDGDVTVNGITGNGSKYINTGASPSATYSPVTSAGQVIYLYNGPGSIASADFGSWASSSFGMMIFAHYNDGKTYDYNGTIAGNAIIINPSPGNGFYSDQRISATDHRLFFANSGTSHTQEGSTDVNSWTSAQSSFSMLFMAESDGGGPESPSNNTDSFVAATKGLNSTQSSNLYNRVQTLRTVLGGGYR